MIVVIDSVLISEAKYLGFQSIVIQPLNLCLFAFLEKMIINMDNLFLQALSG